MSNNDIRFEVDQLGSQGRKPVPLIFGKAILQMDGLALDIAELAKALRKGLKVAVGGHGRRRSVRREYSNQRYVAPLLGLDGKRH